MPSFAETAAALERDADERDRRAGGVTSRSRHDRELAARLRAATQTSLVADPPPLPTMDERDPRHEQPRMFEAPQTIRGQLAMPDA